MNVQNSKTGPHKIPICRYKDKKKCYFALLLTCLIRLTYENSKVVNLVTISRLTIAPHEAKAVKTTRFPCKTEILKYNSKGC